MILPDWKIQEAVSLGQLEMLNEDGTPLFLHLQEDILQPHSVDLTLGSKFITKTRRHSDTTLDCDLYIGSIRSAPMDGVVRTRETISGCITLKPPLFTLASNTLSSDGAVILQQGDFVLASTREYVHIKRGLVGHVHGKSSVARFGVIVHAAGLVDCGFCGQITLEIANFSPEPFVLAPGMKICQIEFHMLAGEPMRKYGDKHLKSHYQGQMGPTPGVIDTI